MPKARLECRCQAPQPRSGAPKAQGLIAAQPHAIRHAVDRAPATVESQPGVRDWGRSTRLGPSRRRRGSRRCGTPRASAHRRGSPAHRDERRLRSSAAGAPARPQGSARSAGGPSASYRASRPRRCRGSGSRPCMRRTEPAARLRALRPRGSPAECSPLTARSRPSRSQFSPITNTWAARRSWACWGASCCRGALRVRPAGYPQQLRRLDLQHRAQAWR